jgi:hypothetical protein
MPASQWMQGSPVGTIRALPLANGRTASLFRLDEREPPTLLISRLLRTSCERLPVRDRMSIPLLHP